MSERDGRRFFAQVRHKLFRIRSNIIQSIKMKAVRIRRRIADLKRYIPPGSIFIYAKIIGVKALYAIYI